VCQTFELASAIAALRNGGLSEGWKERVTRTGQVTPRGTRPRPDSGSASAYESGSESASTLRIGVGIVPAILPPDVASASRGV
jgi:hypothetical protein